MIVTTVVVWCGVVWLLYFIPLVYCCLVSVVVLVVLVAVLYHHRPLIVLIFASAGNCKQPPVRRNCSQLSMLVLLNTQCQYETDQPASGRARPGANITLTAKVLRADFLLLVIWLVPSPAYHF